MNKFRRNCLIISLVCFAIAAYCIFGIVDMAHAAAIGHDNVPVPGDLKRNHSNVVLTIGGNDITIHHRYIGKEPEGTYRFKHDYKAIDTDFYRWEFVNNTPYDIEFLTMRSWPERETGSVTVEIKDTGKQKKSSVMTLDLIKAWKYNIVGANKTWVRNNHYYYSSGKNWNKRYVEYTVRINGKIYKLLDYMVYIR